MHVNLAYDFTARTVHCTPTLQFYKNVRDTDTHTLGRQQLKPIMGFLSEFFSTIRVRCLEFAMVIIP